MDRKKAAADSSGRRSRTRAKLEQLDQMIDDMKIPSTKSPTAEQDRENLLKKRNALYSQRIYYRAKSELEDLEHRRRSLLQANKELRRQNDLFDKILTNATEQIELRLDIEGKMSQLADSSFRANGNNSESQAFQTRSPIESAVTQQPHPNYPVGSPLSSHALQRHIDTVGLLRLVADTPPMRIRQGELAQNLRFDASLPQLAAQQNLLFRSQQNQTHLFNTETAAAAAGPLVQRGSMQFSSSGSGGSVLPRHYPREPGVAHQLHQQLRNEHTHYHPEQLRHHNEVARQHDFLEARATQAINMMGHRQPPTEDQANAAMALTLALLSGHTSDAQVQPRNTR